MKIIEAALSTDNPILVMGEPGIGKTKSIEAIARKLKRPLVTVLASIREPSDFSGLPVITAEGGVKLAAPQWADELGDDGILFLDEMNSAPPSVQAALLRVVFDKVVGEKKLGKNVRIIAAVNPPEYAANGIELAPPLANRFMHVKFKLDPLDWVNNFPDYWNFAPSIETLDEQEWAKARGIVAAYIGANPTSLLMFPSGKEESKRSGPWPSPRTWDYASRVLALTQDPHILVEGFVGTVGEGAAMQFHTWLKNADLPQPEDVLKNWQTFKFPQGRADKLFAILTGVVAVVKNNPTKDRWEAGWGIIGKAIDEGHPDIAANVGRSLVQLLFREEKKLKFPFPDELKKFHQVFSHAKMGVK